MEKVCDIDVGSESFTYLDAKHATLPGLRRSCSGSASSESSATRSTTPARSASTSGTRCSSRQGMERLAVRPRAAAHPAPREDAHPGRPGHRLESNPLEAAMSWIVKLDKEEFVGKWSIEQVRGVASTGCSSASRCRTAGFPSRVARSSRRKVVRAHHERPLERATRQDDRHGGRPDPVRRGRPTFDIESTAPRAGGRATKPFFDPDGHTCAHEQSRLPLARPGTQRPRFLAPS